jgi:uncharacterized membrane protein YkvA (DUF1232 family)
MKSLVESFYVWYRNQLKHPKYRWLIVGGTLLYLLSPIDISPDFIPFAGWIDDGIIATILATEITSLVLESRRSRKVSEQVEDATVDVQPQ